MAFLVVHSFLAIFIFKSTVQPMMAARIGTGTKAAAGTPAGCNDKAMFCRTDVGLSWFKESCTMGGDYYNVCEGTCCREGHGRCECSPSLVEEEATATQSCTDAAMFCHTDVSQPWFKSSCETGEGYYRVCEGTCCSKGHGNCACRSSLVEKDAVASGRRGCTDKAMFCANDADHSWFKSSCENGGKYYGVCEASCCRKGHGSCECSPSLVEREATATRGCADVSMFCLNDVRKSWFKTSCEKGEGYYSACEKSCCREGYGRCGCKTSLMEKNATQG